jgi:hypothetical protein
MLTSRQGVLAFGLLCGVTIPAAGRDRYINVTNPVILTRQSCIATYLAAANTGGKDGADVMATLEHDGCIRRLEGIYELQDMDPDQHDQNFIHATLRLNLAEMQRRDPQYEDKDLVKSPPVVIGYVFRSQIPKK